MEKALGTLRDAIVQYRQEMEALKVERRKIAAKEEESWQKLYRLIRYEPTLLKELYDVKD